jgi:hypothetical protein
MNRLVLPYIGFFALASGFALLVNQNARLIYIKSPYLFEFSQFLFALSFAVNVIFLLFARKLRIVEGAILFCKIQAAASIVMFVVVCPAFWPPR